MSDLSFAKQPVSPISPAKAAMGSTASSAVPSDNESVDSRSHPPPISLLSTLLSSPEHQRTSRPSSGAGLTSSGTTAPSTALNSPNGLPDSILRRGSTSSEAGDAPHFLGFGQNLEKINTKLTMVEEAREHVEWQAQPADAPPKRTCSLKFAIAPSANATKTPAPAPPPLDRKMSYDDEDIDQGYEEDSEGGFDDDDDISTWGPTVPLPAAEYPFARPTNYGDHRSRSPSPPPVEPRLPPPSRRGRGHIRVADNSTEQEQKKCSRHRSPPPAASRDRAGSRGRLSDAGPRDGRAGSPMPSRVFESDDSEDEEPDSPVRARGGWRSDDYGLKSPPGKDLDRPASTTPMLSASTAGSGPLDSTFSVSTAADGVRGFLRRASEHLPGFRRPSLVTGEKPSEAWVKDLEDFSLNSPKVDHPAAHDGHEGLSDRDLLLQLQKSLSGGAAMDLQRSKSSSGKVSFAEQGAGKSRPVQCGPRLE